jgi:acyl-CoA dehydrogenase
VQSIRSGHPTGFSRRDAPLPIPGTWDLCVAVRHVPPFTAEHEALRGRARAFVLSELRPHAPEWEAARSFPRSVFARCAQEGWLGLKYPARYGGSDRGYVADAVWVEELSRCGSGGLAAGLGAHVGIATPPVWKFGSEEQKQRWLAPAIRGEKIGALAISEPDAGSDVASIRTHARRDGDGWIVNGSKTFITNGVRADFYVTAVKTRSEGGHHGLSFLVIERGDGVSARPLEKLGWHASDTAELAFDGVFVPDEHRLGDEGRGFHLIMANFQWERLAMALGAVGSMRSTLERVIAFARERSLGQAVRHALAEQAVRLEAGAALTYEALRRFAGGADAVREVTMAKLATQRACFELQDACLSVVMGAGVRDADLERAARDARLGPIGGGTDEIMREILGRGLGL